MKKETALANLETGLTTEQYQSHLKDLQEFIKAGMKEGKYEDNSDYGIFPGTKTKQLYKKGAEKLARKFGLAPEYKVLNKVEDLDKGFFYIQTECRLMHIATGKFIGSAIGSCNSREKMFRNSTVYDSMHNIEQKASKRALVMAVRTATLASEIFGGDGYEASDEKGPTIEANPNRIKLQGKFFAVGEERGFNTDKLHQHAKTKFNVESFNDITDGQLQFMIDELESKYDVVGKGSKPVRIGEENPTPSPSTSPSPITPEVINDEEDDTPIKVVCYECGKDVLEEGTYFCNDKCKAKWNKKRDAKAGRKSESVISKILKKD